MTVAAYCDDCGHEAKDAARAEINYAYRDYCPPFFTVRVTLPKRWTIDEDNRLRCPRCTRENGKKTRRKRCR